MRGFTMVETLVVLAIGSMLLALSVPGFSRQRAEAAVRTAASQTMAALHLARRLALARGQHVTVCPSPDGQRCDFSGREWLLFANAAGGADSRLEPGDELLRRWEVPTGVVLDGTRGYAAFHSRPGSATTVTIRFHHASGKAATRSIVVSQTGRPRMTPPE